MKIKIRNSKEAPISNASKYHTILDRLQDIQNDNAMLVEFDTRQEATKCRSSLRQRKEIVGKYRIIGRGTIIWIVKEEK